MRWLKLDAPFDTLFVPSVLGEDERQTFPLFSLTPP